MDRAVRPGDRPGAEPLEVARWRARERPRLFPGRPALGCRLPELELHFRPQCAVREARRQTTGRTDYSPGRRVASRRRATGGRRLRPAYPDLERARNE